MGKITFLKFIFKQLNNAQDDTKIWQVNIITWQVMAEICHHRLTFVLLLTCILTFYANITNTYVLFICVQKTSKI